MRQEYDNKFYKKIFGSANDRLVKRYFKIVEKINKFEDKYASMSDEELQAQTGLFKERLANGETLDDITPEAFAVVREASKRVLGMRPFDVQLVGGLVLHSGQITEMRTGEGKTLVATLPIYLNALTGKGVHLVTVNDYLVQRDAAWMGQIYNFLGLSYGCIVHGLTDEQRRTAYNADITYATNHELGFDYLRDNMKFRLGDMVQRPFHYAIVDEVDSILIDEARTPLIISGAAEDSSDLYAQVNLIIPKLTPEHYEKDEKQRSVVLNEIGIERVEELLRQADLLRGETLYDVQNIGLVHHVNQALRAHILFTRDVDYMVKNDKVMIIDEFTGRMMEGRRYSEGLHQALEAKEGVTIEMENQTLASITYQNFFRMYPKLAGMTGTGMTEAGEFEEIYKLSVVDIPTNVPIARIDHDDEVYLTAAEKYQAMIETIKECRRRMQPVLVGTASIEKSEHIAKLLEKEKIPHQVLNARYHDKEALIIADAGYPGAVTIATNMAGRGTDIKLGGNFDVRVANETAGVEDEQEKQKIIQRVRKEITQNEAIVKEAGGLYVIGTERHESRRIDNQLRGRSGRQGDPGASKFYISLQDDLMRIFGSDRLDAMLRRFGAKEGEAISHSWISKALERAQQKVEARNFDIRKHLLRYDDVMNDQRKVIYEQRRDLMDVADISETIQEMRHEGLETAVRKFIPENSLSEQWDGEGLQHDIHRIFALQLPIISWTNEEGITEREILGRLTQAVMDAALAKERQYGVEMMRSAEKSILLRMLDQCWKDHLLMLDHLRQGIQLRAYAQSNPLNEYKREAFVLFQEMLHRLREETILIISHLEMHVPDPSVFDSILGEGINFDKFEEQTPDWTESDIEAGASSADVKTFPKRKKANENVVIDPNDPSTWGNTQRNALCPCGSGKKYKHCHGALT
ncbi:preprotein translocase subunit SecA [Candidatus Paracaedibacter symbiosus]|uniref:preprotein translocase subunit SecA n=1 Tax=Candidatus Paracaedibacter symbiosus TaxID=244582 RepID=UPI000509F905|nr:preprotein translocase subunit SecA [Candidatus Paracaedibacter symbiosus]